jgi:hypothetical protein
VIVTTGKVHDGAIQIEPKSLPEGMKVMVLAMEGDETFELSAEDEGKLLEAIAELERGEFVDAPDLLKELHGR